MANPQQPNNGWHGQNVHKGWYDGDPNLDPRTGAPRGGWSKKTTSKQKFKKWAKGKTKAQIKQAKRDIKKFRRQHETTRGREKRLQHDREMRATRKERTERQKLHRDTNNTMRERRQEWKDIHNGKRTPVMPCKWCPVEIQLVGGQWVHVDGQPCRSHEYDGGGMFDKIKMASKLFGDPS